MHACMLIGRILLFEILWTIAHQSSLYMKFYRQEYECHALLQDLTTQGISPHLLHCRRISLLLNQQGSPINLSVSKSINKSIYLSTSYWFCYSGESSLIQWFKTQLEIKSYGKVLINGCNSYFMNWCAQLLSHVRPFATPRTIAH